MERYCPEKGCPGGDGCINKRHWSDGKCLMEYVDGDLESQYRWIGEGPPPPRWFAPNGTLVYRSYADYCDD